MFFYVNPVLRCLRFLRFLAEEELDIVLDGADAGNAEVVDQNVCDIRGKESRKRRSEVDVLHAKVEQGKQNDDRLLLVPRDVEENRQVVDVVCTKNLFQFECHHCPRIRVVEI